MLDAQALVGHLVPAGSVYAFLAEHRATVFPDELFADLFASGRGRPSVPGPVIASVLVLQALEGLSDCDAAEAQRCDLRWKAARGLPLDDDGLAFVKVPTPMCRSYHAKCRALNRGGHHTRKRRTKPTAAGPSPLRDNRPDQFNGWRLLVRDEEVVGSKSRHPDRESPGQRPAGRSR